MKSVLKPPFRITLLNLSKLFTSSLPTIQKPYCAMPFHGKLSFPTIVTLASSSLFLSFLLRATRVRCWEEQEVSSACSSSGIWKITKHPERRGISFNIREVASTLNFTWLKLKHFSMNYGVVSAEMESSTSLIDTSSDFFTLQ